MLIFFKLYFSLSCFSSSAGLKQIHALSVQGNYELRIDLEDFENSTAYAQYGTFGVGLFSVDPDDDGYPLTVGDYSGNAGMHINHKKLILPFLRDFHTSLLINARCCLQLNDRIIFPLCSRCLRVCERLYSPTSPNQRA